MMNYFPDPNYLVKAVSAGAINAGASMWLYGSGSVPLLGMEIPVAIPLFLSGFGATFSAHVVGNMITPNLTSSERLQNLSTAATGLAAAGGGSALVLKLVGVPNENLLQGATIGAGSFIAAEWGVDMFLSKNQASNPEVVF